jgi:hypothetical protein
LYVGRLQGVNDTGFAYTVSNLASGNTVNISCNADNDNATGDPRGMGITTFVYLSNGTLSRRFTTTTEALQTWETLVQTITLQPGENHLTTYFETAFNQPLGFVDNIYISVIQ